MLHISTPEPTAHIVPPDYAAPDKHRHSHLRRFHAPATTVYRQGYRKSPAYRIVAGCIALSQVLPDGRRQIIDILGPGRIFGLALDDQNPCSAETLTYTEIEMVDGEGDRPEIDRELYRMLSRVQHHATLLGRKTAQEKVATAILDLSEQFMRPSRSRGRIRTTFPLYLTRADLADWLGLTVETVSRCLNRFKRSGLVDFRRPEVVTITDRAALASIATNAA